MSGYSCHKISILIVFKKVRTIDTFRLGKSQKRKNKLIKPKKKPSKHRTALNKNTLNRKTVNDKRVNENQLIPFKIV